MEDFRNEIISRVRSCLISTKGRITVRQLEADYRTLLGERIPYQKLGHKTLESFIESVPTLLTSHGPNGEVFVDAQVSEKSAHISDMVKKQKPAAVKKKVRITPIPTFHKNYAQPTTTTFPKWRPKTNSYAQQPKKSYERSPRIAAVSHNQFVNGGGYKKPTVPSKVVVVGNFNNNNNNNNNTNKPSPPKELRRYNSIPEKATNDSNGAVSYEEFRDDCSPLSSTMRRISKIMSGMSLDRDSGNSSPTTEFAPTFKEVKFQEFVKTGEPIQDIRNFAAYHKLGGVEVKFTETQTKKSKVAQYHCKLTVGQHKYSSYPDDFYDKAAAEKHASQKALTDLMLKYSKRKSLLLSSNEDIIERIPPMLEKHNNAVWMWQIEADYIDKYNEQLPSDWLQVIDKNPHVSIEKCSGGYVLKHCNPDDVLQKGKKIEMKLSVGDVSVPCNTVNVGDNNRLYALVTAAQSANEIWCQQCGTPDYERFAAMINKMESFYTTHKSELLVQHINIGSCYVVNHDEGWMRVRALDLPRDGRLDCFLIDYGEEERVPLSSVYIMRREFALEQAQAFVCRLDGLEEFQEASVGSDHLATLIGREVVLEIVLEEPSDDIILTVVMYDVHTAASINEELISLLTIESAAPVLDKNVISEVYVSNIESNGDVYVQVHSVGYHRLNELLQELVETMAKNPPVKLLTPRPSKETSNCRIYLIKCAKMHKWLRATIIDWSPNGDFAQVYFVDVGHTQVVKCDEPMFPLEKLDEVVNQYPPQAIKVRFMIEKIPGDFVERAEKLLPRDQAVLCKITSYDNEGVAWVEFFKRTNDGVLVFINKSISVEAELQNSDLGVSGSNNETTRKRLINLVQFGDASKTVPSGGSLKKPDLPKIGDYFNVNIPVAVNPWNFFVQPLDSFKQLAALMADMQNCYKDLQFSPMQIEDIVPGKIYASKHEDGKWYRTSVLKVIHSGSISVFYCDFGHYTNLTLAQLVPLNAKYMGFPYQALKAKISGIKPIKNKWTMEDCDVFNNLVVKKQFVSILVNIEKDELYKSDIVLQLLLIDTSSDEDVHIKEVLIEKGIATNA